MCRLAFSVLKPKPGVFACLGLALCVGLVSVLSDRVSAQSDTNSIPIELNDGDIFVNAPVGVKKDRVETREIGFTSPLLGVRKDITAEENPPVLIHSPAAGVHFGPGVLSISPNRLTVGQDAQLIEVAGFELQVAEARLFPEEDTAVVSITSLGDGSQISVTVDVGVDAQPGLRRLVMIDANGNEIPELIEQASLVLVSDELPEIDSISPSLVAQGDTFELVIRGRHLRGLPFARGSSLNDPIPDVLLTPEAEIVVGETPIVNDEGTIVTVPIQVLPNASTQSRVVQVSTRSGITTDLATPANTLNISDQSLRELDGFHSPLLGVEREVPSFKDFLLTSTLAGLLKGAGIVSIDPQTVERGQMRTLRISGNELAATSQVQIVPGDGITIDATSLNVTGEWVEVDIEIAVNAPLFEREVRLLSDGPELVAPQLLRPKAAAPVVEAISPNYLVREGIPALFTVQGQNFSQVTSAALLPAADLILQDFTPLSDRLATMTVLANPQAELGSRVLQVNGIDESSSPVPDDLNSLFIVDVGQIAEPFVSPLLGVVRQSDETPAPNILLYSNSVNAVKGPVATQAQPDIIEAGSTLTISVSGQELDTVIDVIVEPGQDVAVDQIEVSPDGSQLDFDLIASASAVPGRRTLILNRSGGTVAFYPFEESQITLIAPGGSGPIAEDDEYAVSVNGFLQIEAESGVLDNDVDPQGLELSAALVGVPAAGNVSLDTDGGFSYTPNPDFVGQDEFRYVANNGSSVSAAATVRITINEPDDAVNDDYALLDNEVLSIDAEQGLLANDLISSPGTVAIVLDSNPQLGDLQLVADGSFVYTPTVSSGIDTFAYRLVSDASTSLPAIVRIEITDFIAPDVDGPLVENLRYRGQPLSAGATLSQTGMLTLAASDESGVARVRFVSSGNLDVSDTSGQSSAQAFWPLELEVDGPQMLTVIAEDTVGNQTLIDLSVVIALAPPPAPQITAPVDGLRTNQSQLIVEGLAPRADKVRVLLGGNPIGNWFSPENDESFAVPISLVPGNNLITAIARNNRLIEGPMSAPVTAILDTELPDAPVGLSASAREAGVIRVRWQAGAAEVESYDVYRATVPFAELSEAEQVNSSPVTELLFDDATPVDQRYYYRVVAESVAGNLSEPSVMVEAVADRTPPRALSIEYFPEGPFDPGANRFGPGPVSVTVNLSEPLLAKPFLAMTPEGGVPMIVDLFRIDGQVWQGSFDILEQTVSATTWAVFAARDQAGNRGTEVDSGETILVDSDGPDVQALDMQPSAPIRNDGGTTLTLALELTEAVTGPNAPELEFELSGQPGVWDAATSLTEIDPLNWTALYDLPSSAGQVDAETLTVRWRAEDDLGNIGDRILSPNQFQVYQNELPPLDPPGMLDVWALPAGQVGLMWAEVDQAAAYEVWRRLASGGTFAPVDRIMDLDYVDQTPVDDVYEYTVVSVRQANGQEALSGPGPIREVTTRSTAPEPPQNLDLQLSPSGIVAQWQAPNGDGLTYNLYRSELLEIIDLTGLEPVVAGTPNLFALDADPLVGENTYAVTALDEAGNESLPSESVYLNFDLVPVSSLTIERFADQAPEINWTHNAQSLAGFDVYARLGPSRFKLNQGLLTAPEFVDSAYVDGPRAYEVVAVDSNDQESLGRVLLMPEVDVELAPDARLRRGLIDGVEVTVRNIEDEQLDELTLRLDLAGQSHQSEVFQLEPFEVTSVRVPVPGYPQLGDEVGGGLFLEYRPQLNDLVRIGQTVQLPVENGGMVVTLLTDTFTRGGVGRVRARIENPGDEDVQILTASSNGNQPSPDLRLKLFDELDNVLSVKPFEQFLGDDVVTQPSGFTVATIPAGSSWTSQWQDMLVPASSPTQVWVELDIDFFYYAFGQSELELVLDGLSTRREASLVDTSYFGELESATPANSFGTQPIQIQGRAVERATSQPMTDVPLNLVLSNAGFEREISVTADSEGLFTYLFEPLPSEAGIYEVAVVHPEILDRPVQGIFTIERLSIRPSRFDLFHPYNTPWTIPVEVTAGIDTQANQLRFEYRAEDQLDGTLIPGLNVDVSQLIDELLPGEKANLNVVLEAGDTAPSNGSVYLRLTSEQAGGQSLAMLEVNFQFTSADPQLVPAPASLNFGLAQGETRSATTRISNRGFADAEAVQLAIKTADGQAAPAWINLGIDPGPRTIAIGEHIDVPITVSPPAGGPALSETFLLELTSSNHPTGVLPLNVAVTQEGEGSALFHVRNMYTATLDESGQLIEGLEGARIRLQDEIVLSNVFEGTTNEFGEVLLEDIPAGQYLFRVTAPNHEAGTGRITIQPEILEFESIFLSYNLVEIQWSVTETTIEDVYEITLSAIFETNVPAAVLTTEPLNRTIPDMQQGDVFNTQFTLTNHGLIRAINLSVQPPPEDAFFRYELIGELPAQLEAQQSIIVPYRLIAKQDFPPTDAGAGGCFSYNSRFQCPYGYLCADGTEDSGNAQHLLSKAVGSNCGGGGPGNDNQTGGQGGCPFCGVWGYEPGGAPISGTTCAPDCVGDECCDKTEDGG